jgi:hypothetical protein
MQLFARLGMPAGQRGWVGLIVILVALIIVAVLAKEALKQYGLASGAPATKAGAPAERVRAPGAGGVGAFDPGAGPPSPASAIERARGVEDTIRRQAEERAGRDDGTGK